MSDLERFVTVDDYEAPARDRLPADVYDYIAGGAGDDDLDLSTEVLGTPLERAP